MVNNNKAKDSSKKYGLHIDNNSVSRFLRLELVFKGRVFAIHIPVPFIKTKSFGVGVMLNRGHMHFYKKDSNERFKFYTLESKSYVAA